MIADDHEMVRDGLRKLFAEIGGIEIVGVAEDGLAAIAMARKFRPDLMTLDMGMPLANGAEVFADVRRWSPETKVAVFTGLTSASLLKDWLNAGVDGLFLKTCDHEELRDGISFLLAGRRHVHSEIKVRLKDLPKIPMLTDREREVLFMIAKGLTTTDTALALRISPKTVEKYRTSLFQKFGVSSVTALLSSAFRLGLMEHFDQG